MGQTPRKQRRGLSRRDFLGHAGVGAAALPFLSACGGNRGPAPGAGTPFQHGIATGDPTSQSIIFWTRITTTAEQAPVSLTIYRDPELQEPVASREAVASAARDFTVKLDVGGLQPATSYYYQFSSQGVTSAIGRTRTAPAAGRDRLRFGVVSCASYAHGFFNGYRRLAERQDLDAILHLGDYIYEYGTGEYGNIRAYEPDHEMVTLQDYRTRHAYYKQDPDLIELHRQYPFITIWDDHESTDNSWRDGANNHTEGEEGVWVQRKAWAQQAYDEWLPIRYPQTGQVDRIWRKFRYGDMAEIFMLDSRLYDRDEPGPIPADTAQSQDPERRMLGPEQMNWLLEGLASSSAQWKIVGTQVVFHQWQIGAPESGAGLFLNGDAWDGYQAERTQIMDHIREQGINNVVFLSGDVHSSWCADITPNPSDLLSYDPLSGNGSLAVEFTTTSLTSPFAIDIPEGQQAFLASNPHIRYTDFDEKGYLLLDLSESGAQGEYWYVSQFEEPGGSESFATAYRTSADANHLDVVPVGSSPAKDDPPPFAP